MSWFRRACRIVQLLSVLASAPAMAGLFEPPEAYFSVVRDESYSAPMSFSIGRDALHAEVAFATGTITRDTAADFAAFVVHTGLKAGTTIFLHSPGGGDIANATALGRYIRKQSFQTSVGQAFPVSSRRSPWSDAAEGVCVGSCTLAFLGGVFRDLPRGSFLDVYQTYTNLNQPHLYFDKGTLVGQRWSALFANYLTEMSVDPVFYEFATQPLSTEKLRTHYIPDGLELRSWNVITDNHATSWEVQVRDKSFALVGTNPDSPSAPGFHDEIAFLCGASHHYVMEIDYLPPAEFSLNSVSQYELGRWLSPVNDQYTSAGKEAGGELAIRPEWIVSKFISLSDRHIRGQILLTPEMTEYLLHTDVLMFQFYRNGEWPWRLEVDFAAGSDLLTELTRVPCK